MATWSGAGDDWMGVDMVKGKEQSRLEIWHIAASLRVEPHPAVDSLDSFPSPPINYSRIYYQSINHCLLLVHEEVSCVM